MTEIGVDGKECIKKDFKFTVSCFSCAADLCTKSGRETETIILIKLLGKVKHIVLRIHNICVIYLLFFRRMDLQLI